MIADMARGKPSKKPRSSFGKRLVAAREQAGLTQEQLGEMLDVSQRAVAHWERTPTALYPEQLQALAKALKISADELLGLKPAKAKPGRKSRLQERMEQLEQLPRPKQAAILQVLDMALKS